MKKGERVSLRLKHSGKSFTMIGTVVRCRAKAINDRMPVGYEIGIALDQPEDGDWAGMLDELRQDHLLRRPRC